MAETGEEPRKKLYVGEEPPELVLESSEHEASTPNCVRSPKVVKGGTVGVISGDLSRYSIFSMCLLNLLSYSGEIVSYFDWLTGSNITGNCNELASACKGTGSG